MAAAHDFSKMVPGFDFLQGLVSNASSALPSLGQWVAPTLDPQELDKRIEELKTVQFWLEQNARMIGTTVQALEVQRMTLTTLKTMNVQVADLAEAFKLKDPAPASKSAPSPAPAPKPATASAPAPAPVPAPAPAASGAAGPGVVDPMQWWGALTQQFTQLAAQALKERPVGGAPGAGPQPAAAGGAGKAGKAGAARKTAAKTVPTSSSKTARASQPGQPAGGRAARRKA